MTVSTITFLLLVLLFLFIVALAIASKQKRNKIQKRHLAYIHQIVEQTGLVSSYQKQLIHQFIILDEMNKKLLIIEHSQSTYGHSLIPLEDIKSFNVLNITQNLIGSPKSESFTSQIILQISFCKTELTSRFLVFYDHIRHNLYLMSELEREANRLKERIQQAMQSSKVS